MRKGHAWLGVAALILGAVIQASAANAAIKETDRVVSAAEVMDKVMDIPEKAIPSALLDDAQGIAIIPGVIKVGFVLGGQYGRGVLVVRGKGGAWSDPVFVSLMSGSVGWQIGAESTDFVIVFKTRKSIEGIMKGKYTLGADAGVAAGPVGRHAGASTDVELKAEIYTYSRSRGAFAGVSLEGSALQVDDDANAAFYQRKEISPATILEGGRELHTPTAAGTLKKKLEKYSPTTGKE